MQHVSSAHWGEFAHTLEKLGVQHVFGLPGDDLEAYRAFVNSTVEFHLVGDQRHGAYQALASVVTGVQAVGILVLGKGPAVTHALTGILEAKEQRTPLLVVTSGVGPSRLGSGAFQELDAVRTLSPVVNRSATLESPTQMESVVNDLFRFAKSGGGSVAHLEVPENITVGRSVNETAGAVQQDVTREAAQHGDEQRALAAVLSAIRMARRPVFLIGGGGRRSVENGRLELLADRLSIPLLSTASGRGLIDEEHPLCMGVAGLYLPQAMQGLMVQTDLIVALGSRLEETARTGWDESQIPVVQVNLNKQDFSDAFEGHRLAMDVSDFLDRLEAAPDLNPLGHRNLVQIRARIESAKAVNIVGRSRTATVLKEIVRTAPARWLSVHENGLQDIWSYFADVWTLRAGVNCLAPSEQTPLGFGVSAALGAARIQDHPVVAVVGDGAFLTIASELPHLGELRAPLLYVVIDNGGFGWLQANYDVKESDPFCNRSPKLAAFAQACGFSAVTLSLDDDMTVRIQEAWDRALTPGRKGKFQPVVLCVAADLRDVPPGFEELAGDAPARHTASSSKCAGELPAS